MRSLCIYKFLLNFNLICAFKMFSKKSWIFIHWYVYKIWRDQKKNKNVWHDFIKL